MKRPAHYARDYARRTRTVESRARACLRERLRQSGFTEEMLLACRELQNGLCAVCQVPMVPGRNSRNGECCDHDHATGRPRGLLCRGCNAQLGFYEKIKDKAESYLSNPPVNGVFSGQ